MSLKDFRNIILLILISVIVTIVLPGIFSSIGGTFYLQDIKAKVSQEELIQLSIFEKKLLVIEKDIHNLDNKIKNCLIDTINKKGYTITELLALKEKLVEEKANIKSPTSLIPYYLNPQMLLWVGIYTAFLLLIYLIKSEKTERTIFSKSVFGFSVLLYVFYEWPLWIRNFVLTNKGRTVYAYPNFDIDKYSFFYQEFIIYTFCFLAALLIILSVGLYRKMSKIGEEDNLTNRFLIISSYYSTAYRNWFIRSTILALGFLSFTGFFWRLVFAYGDHRYIISALNAHVLWALCWVAISLNLLKYMQQFDNAKRDILRSNPDDKTLRIVMEHQPANNLTIIISGIASLITFLLPILKTFLQS